MGRPLTPLQEEKLNDPEWLYQEYVISRKKIAEIAEDLNTSKDSVSKYLKKAGVEIRKKSDRTALSREAYFKLTDRDWLHSQYLIEGKSFKEIGRDLGGLAGDTVQIYANKMGIEKTSNRGQALNAGSFLSDASWLEEQFIDLDRSMAQIAKKLSVNKSSVRKWLIHHGIPTSKKGPAAPVVKKQKEKKPYQCYEYMYESYVVQLKSQKEIAEELGVRRDTVRVNLKKLKIPLREPGHPKGMSYENYAKLNDPNWFKEQYEIQGKKTKEIAEELGVSDSTVISKLENFGIPSRTSFVRQKTAHLRSGESLIETYQVQKKSVKEIAEENQVAESTINRLLKKKGVEKISKAPLEAHGKLDSDDWLYNAYVTESRTLTDIAKECNVHHTSVHNRITNRGWGQGFRTTSSSDGEKIIADLLKSINVKFSQNNRSIISPKELDFYIEADDTPSKKSFAIEFNGVYWHSNRIKPNNYHREKYLACKNKKIQLIQIWDLEYLKNTDVFNQTLKRKLGALEQPTVYARKTLVDTDVNKVDADDILFKHHVQGPANASYYYGLRDHYGKLLAVCLFMKRQNNVFELNRYAASVNIPGGFSKLVSAFRKVHPDAQLISFADLMISDGGLYKNNGWVQDKILPPDYKVVYKGQIHHKFNFRKARFKSDKELEWQPNLSEFQLHELNKIYRIYDAGKIRFVMKPLNA